MLEPFCGNARYGPVFAARGVRYWGLDLSPAMLERAPHDDRITLAQCDARDFALADAPAGGFDLGFCPINSIRHLLSEGDVLNHLGCVRSHLTPRGVYVIETDFDARAGPCAPEESAKNRWTMPQPDGSVVHAWWYRENGDIARRIVRERARFWLERAGEIVRELSHAYEMRMWPVNDLRDFAKRSGFAIERVHRNEPKAGWPEVALEPSLESTDSNHFVFLRRV